MEAEIDDSAVVAFLTMKKRWFSSMGVTSVSVRGLKLKLFIKNKRH